MVVLQIAPDERQKPQKNYKKKEKKTEQDNSTTKILNFDESNVSFLQLINLLS